ncbi:MAG: PilZ domain-containing protein [Phycisphaerae bacterium]|nr:PilZ domain-containing protein [Phycisphaerae bacterium]
MFGDKDHKQGSLGADDGFELMQELEKNTPDEIVRQRAGYRHPVKASLTLQSGNASELLDYKIQGVTGDISTGGVSAMFPLPVRVGDVYRLEFDRQQLDLPLTFARCVMCTLVREGAYKCGFRFFASVCLPENIKTAAATAPVVQSWS